MLRKNDHILAAGDFRAKLDEKVSAKAQVHIHAVCLWRHGFSPFLKGKLDLCLQVHEEQRQEIMIPV